MKKKIYISLKKKKKYIITNKNFRILFKKQAFNKTNFTGQNLITFIKKFTFYNFKNAYHIVALFGIKPSMKIYFFSYNH
jgi:hypothetical protein